MAGSSTAVQEAWRRVAYDCGCADVYFCPAGNDVECPRHSGFSVCCDRYDFHEAVPATMREADPRPALPADADDDE